MKSYEEIKAEAIHICEKSESKKYMHFDKPLSRSWKRYFLRKFQNPKFIKSFRHLPFIQFDIKFNKYGYENKDVTVKTLHPKSRKISLPSHHDAFLFKYYGSVLGSCYEEYVKEKNLDDVAVAYRKNKSNITGAKETFDFIWENGNSWIIKGDFSDFFDNLNHQILIKNVKKILNQYTDLKSLGDWLAVLKAITRYRVVRRSELKNIRKKNGKYTENLKQMRNCFKVGKFSISKANCKGIPQGTAMSAVLANVYMIEFDNCVQELLKTYSGFYRRYSDDFALVIPEEKCDFYEVKKISKEIKSLCTKRILLSIKTEKSELLHFVEKNKKIYNENTVLEKNFDFLGFSFTGKNVFLRSKTIYKYHYRGKHAIHLLIRNMNERDIASGKNYEKMKEVYIKSKPIKKQKMISERLDRIRQEVQSGYSLRGRKKITCMYLVNRPIRMKNMAYYADLAQKQLSVPIPGIKTLYGVKVKSKITKKIGQFQKIFGKLKKTRNYL